MNDGIGGFILGGCAMLLVGLFLLSVTAPYRNEAIRQQERACHPGMLLEGISGHRVLCVGGKGETWVVTP